MPKVDIAMGSTETHIYGINGTDIGSSTIRCVTIKTDSQLGSIDVTAGTGMVVTPTSNVITLSVANIPNASLTNSTVTLTSGTGISITGSPLSLGGAATISLSTPVSVTNGGTGAITLTNHGILVGAGTGAVTQLAVGVANTVLLGNAGADPSFGKVPNAALTNSSITITGGTGITVTGSPVSLGGSATISLSSPSMGNNIIGTTSPSLSIAALAGTCWLGINASALSLTKAAAQTPIPYAATVSSLYVYVTGNLSTNAVTVKINVNGTNSGIIATIPALTTGTFTDLTHSASVSAGDQLQFEVSAGLIGIVTGVIVANLRG